MITIFIRTCFLVKTERDKTKSIQSMSMLAESLEHFIWLMA